MKKPLLCCCWCFFSIGRERRKLENIPEDDLQSLTRTHFFGKRIARVASIYDGDTLDLVFLYRKELTRKACRMAEIDTPEMKMKHDRNDTQEMISKKMEIKRKAIEARQYLCDQVMKSSSPNTVVAVFYESDKYGRPLVLLFRGDTAHKPDSYFVFDNSINKELVDRGLAKMYDGTTKAEW